MKNIDQDGNILDTLVDIGFITYDLYQISRDIAQTGKVRQENVNALGLDAAGFALPGITGLGFAGRLASRGDDVVDAAKAMQKLPDSALVCRGGSCLAEQFKAGKGVILDSTGKLEGVSVNSAQNISLGELAKSLPHAQVGVTTVGEIRRLGGDIIRSLKTRTSNQFHSILRGITPEQAEQLFRPTIPNPSGRLFDIIKK